jgi:hypothetical protein
VPLVSTVTIGAAGPTLTGAEPVLLRKVVQAVDPFWMEFRMCNDDELAPDVATQ